MESKFEEISLYCIMGKSGSGKSTILNKLSKDENFKTIIPYTTRPQRKNEKNGIDYWFVDDIFFEQEIICERIYYIDFLKQSWKYGFNIEDFEIDKLKKFNFLITDPQGFIELKRLYKKVKGIYFYIDKFSQFERLINRGDSLKEINRRIENDEKNFKDIENLTDIWMNTELLNENQILEHIIDLI